MAKKRLFTGLQSSGTLHIGNYFGALKPFVETYLDNESFLMVADYHSLTSVKDGSRGVTVKDFTFTPVRLP